MQQELEQNDAPVGRGARRLVHAGFQGKFTTVRGQAQSCRHRNPILSLAWGFLITDTLPYPNHIICKGLKADVFV